MPSRARPPESTSSVVTVLASTPGWRYITPVTSRPERHPLGPGRHVAERGVALQHRLVGRAGALHLEEVVHHGEVRDAGLLGDLRPSRRACRRSPTAGPAARSSSSAVQPSCAPRYVFECARRQAHAGNERVVATGRGVRYSDREGKGVTMTMRVLRYHVGNEHDPGDPWGRSELVIQPDGTLRAGPLLLPRRWRSARGRGASTRPPSTPCGRPCEHAGFPTPLPAALTPGASPRRLIVETDGVAQRRPWSATARRSNCPATPRRSTSSTASIRQLSGDTVDVPDQPGDDRPGRDRGTVYIAQPGPGPVRCGHGRDAPGDHEAHQT